MAFQLRVVVHPVPVQVLLESNENDFLPGEVVAIAEDGRETTRFLVVRMGGLSEPAIVPSPDVTAPAGEQERNSLACWPPS